MKILVLEHPRIQSEKNFNDIAHTPLWSCILGPYAVSSLRSAGYVTDYMDKSGSRSFDELAEEILNGDYDLICVNAVYMWEHTGKLFAFFDKLRSNGFTGHLNLFGFYPTFAFEAIINYSLSVSSVAAGECEHTLLELAGALSGNIDFSTTPGIVSLKNSSIKYINRKPENNPDVFSFPVRNLLKEKTAVILGSRGCYNHCTFCLVPPFYSGVMWRGRSPENIIAEIKELISAGYKDFYFADANFIGPGKKGRERTVRLLNMLRGLNITYGMETRTDDIDEDIAALLFESGMTSLLIGIESCSVRLLDSVSKNSGEIESERAISFLRKAGIEPEIGFLMFLPDATLEDIEKNFDFLKRNNLLGRLDRTANLLCHRQIVFMGTSGYKEFEIQGRLDKNGFLGFEGKIKFADKKVETMAGLVMKACHNVLKSMGNPESPIYYNNNNDSAKKETNDSLVNYFESTLKALK